MTKLTITRGLPGSGKTTHAKQWVADNPRHRARVNRDDLRDLLHGGPRGYEWELEKSVTVAHQAAVRALLMSGKDVICDDMNLANRQVKEWMKLAAEVGAEFGVVDFTNIPLGTCIDRDKTRFLQGGHSVGETYIEQKHQKFIKGKPYPLPLPELPPVGDLVPRPYIEPEAKPEAIIVDLDGTLALMNDRGPYDWHRVQEDDVNLVIADLVDKYRAYHHDRGGIFHLIFMSGRDETCRADTLNWLERDAELITNADTFDEVDEAGLRRGEDYNVHLFMRPAGDTRRDSIVKLELFDQYVRDNFQVHFVLDDRQQVVDMWRTLGLPCFQVAPGDF